MARAAAKKKRDVPPLYMLVADGGRLDPAFQHDQERLMSFRKGTRLVVTVEPDGSRRGVRKWHAIIGKAVKNGLLPWLTHSAADNGLRLALDMYDAKKANNGSWHRVAQSLDEITDEELDEKIELMTALIYRLSGVDPDDFKREMAGAGDERFASDYDKPAAANDEAGRVPERYLEEVVLLHDRDECLIWPYNRNSNGYGRIGADRLLHGTDNRGEKHPLAKLTEAQALAIQSASGTHAEIAAIFNVSASTVGKIKSGASWPHINENTSLPDDDSHASSGDIPADVEPPVSVGGEPNSEEATQQAMVPDAEPDSAGDPASNSAASAPMTAAGDQGAAGPESAPAAELSEEDRAWLKLGALWMLAALPADDPEALRVLRVQVAEIRKLMPKEVSADALARMEAMRVHCRKVCDGQEKLDKRFMAERALAMPAEIEPKPIKTSRSGS